MNSTQEKNLLKKWAPSKPANHEMPRYENMVQDCAKARVILIRHANTVCNARVQALQKENEIRGTTLGEWLDLYSDTSVYDNDLTERGIQQCLMAAKHAKHVNFSVIFVSPMRRALETAYLILKDHPNFQNIKFVVHPDLREKLGGADDVPSRDIQGLFREFNEKFNGNLDSTTFWRHSAEEPMWYAHEQDAETNQRIQKRVGELGGPDHLEQAMYLEIRDRYPGQIESFQHVHNRTENSKKDIQAYLEDHPLHNDEKAAVVAHSMTFRFWIAQEQYWNRPDAFEQVPPPEVSYNVRNCEFYPDTKNFSV